MSTIVAKYDGRAQEIRTRVVVMPAIGGLASVPAAVKCVAVWDTGSNNSVIDASVARKLGLTPITNAPDTRFETIALDVETAADWGRVVYVVRDAKGEVFTSVGNVDTYNVDDPKCESFFNFSGRRLVRFPLPGNRPWDRSHLAGSCWWGASGGDSIVDYPLVLENIYVERRTKAMNLDDVAEIKPSPALFGDLYVENVRPASELAMPEPPADAPKQNPIAAMEGTLPPSEITGVTHPSHYYDGTRGHFAFTEMPDAKSYDIYVSLSPTGEGAILLKKGAKASGELVRGFLPNTDNYAFVVWHDAKGATSKPSVPFKFRLKDEFAEK